MAITMAELNQALEKVDLEIEDAIARGDTQTAAKLTEDARQIADFIYQSSQDPTNQIPDMPIDGTQAPAPQPNFGDKVKGTLQTMGTLAAGATGGTVGMVGGAIGGGIGRLANAILNGEYNSDDAARLVQEAAMEGSERGTKALYDPQYNQVAQQQLQALAPVGDAMNAVLPLTGGMVAAKTMIGNNRMTGANLANSGAGQAVGAMGKAAKSTKERIMEKIREREQAKIDAQDESVKSMGAAQNPQEKVIYDLLQSFDPPIPATKSQLTRNADDIRDEERIAGSPLGLPLRERVSESSKAIGQNFDRFRDSANPSLFSSLEVGDDALVVLNDYYRTRLKKNSALYEKAKAAGELEAPIAVPMLVDHLNKNLISAKINPIIQHTIDMGVDLGVFGKNPDGTLFIKNAPIENIETLRTSIGEEIDYQIPKSARAGGKIKGIIDESLQGGAGDLYKIAIKDRANIGQLFERNSSLVKDLISKEKGTVQRKVAAADLTKDLLNPSTNKDDLIALGRVFLKSGAQGRQAVQNIRAETLNHLRNLALEPRSKDEFGNEQAMPTRFVKTVDALDKAGKLNPLLGYKDAQHMRDLADVMIQIKTYPQGTRNVSGTSNAVFGQIANIFNGLSGGKLTKISPMINALRITAGMREKHQAHKKALKEVDEHLNYQNRYKPQE